MAEREVCSRLYQEEGHMRASVHSQHSSQDNPMIRKLESIFTLTDDELKALEALPMQLAVIKEKQDMYARATVPPGPASS